MATRYLNGIIDSATRATHTDHARRNARLGHQILKGGVEVTRPLFDLNLRHLLRRQLIEWVTTAVPKAAVIQREHVDSHCRELLGQTVPNLALAVALMQQ